MNNLDVNLINRVTLFSNSLFTDQIRKSTTWILRSMAYAEHPNKMIHEQDFIL